MDIITAQRFTRRLRAFSARQSWCSTCRTTYRDLEECLALIKGYVEEVTRFAVVAYMGHL
jgi:DTW domain-containing protein YfiP